MSRPYHYVTALSLAALFAVPSLAAAQVLSTEHDTTDHHKRGPITASGEPRFQVGLSLSAAQTLGDFHEYVKDGVGVAGHVLYRVDPQGAFALRLDGGFLNYGSETIRLPLSTLPGGGRVQLDVETNNNIFWLGVGPQLMAPSGRVRPYVNATAGFSYFATTSSVSGRSNDESFADDTNFDDTPFSWGGGAGILIPVTHKERSLVFIDIGARYHNNGKSVQYLREGGIQDLPNGAIQLSPIRSRADLVTWHVGVSIGVR
jgi:opacity protein-like surface antigen